jgi:hypothetical protein
MAHNELGLQRRIDLPQARGTVFTGKVEEVNPDVRIYSAATLATFLGWKEAKVEAILVALAVEKGLVIEEDFEGLTTYIRPKQSRARSANSPRA